MWERRERSLSFLSFLPRRERRLLAGNPYTCVILYLNGWTLPKIPPLYSASHCSWSKNWVLANWNYTLFTPAENDMSLAPSNSKFYWLITKSDRGTEKGGAQSSLESPPSLANSFCNGNTDREESDHCRSPFILPFSHPFSKTGQWYQRTGNYLSL